jgi:hypothetical protein
VQPPFYPNQQPPPPQPSQPTSSSYLQNQAPGDYHWNPSQPSVSPTSHRSAPRTGLTTVSLGLLVSRSRIPHVESNLRRPNSRSRPHQACTTSNATYPLVRRPSPVSRPRLPRSLRTSNPTHASPPRVSLRSLRRPRQTRPLVLLFSSSSFSQCYLFIPIHPRLPPLFFIYSLQVLLVPSLRPFSLSSRDISTLSTYLF